MRYLKIALFFLIAVGIALFLRSTDWNQVAAALKLIGWNAIWLIVFTFLSAAFGALAWHYCILGDRNGVTWLDLFLVRHIGETVGGLNPTGIVAGDGVKAQMLTSKGVDRQAALTSIVVSRTLTVLSHFAVFIGSALCINLGFSLRVIGVFAVAFGLIYLIGRVAHLAIERWLANSTGKVKDTWLTIKQQYRTLIQFDKRALSLSFLFLCIHWMMGGAEFMVIVYLLGENINLAQACLIDTGVGFFKAAGILIPGQLGFEEYGNKFMLEAVGVKDEAIWITASILRRARQVFWLLFGVVTYWWRYRT